MGRMKVLIAGDKEVFREGLARLLEEQEDIEVICQCNNGEQALEKAKKIVPDLVLIDTVISQRDNTEIVRQICESSREVKVAIITDSKDREDLFSAIEAGVTGYLFKDMKVADVVKSVDLVAKGEVVVSPPIAEKLTDKFTQLKTAEVRKILSDRELEILKLLAKGLTNNEIADRLFITENTAKVHVKNILEKLQLRNRQQAAAYAVQRGWVTEVKSVD